MTAPWEQPWVYLQEKKNSCSTARGVSMQLGRYELLCEVVVYWSATHICNWALLVIKGKKPSEKV